MDLEPLKIERFFIVLDGIILEENVLVEIKCPMTS